MAEGGFVTVINNNGGIPFLRTFAGVKPDDVLHVEVGGETINGISFEITVPTDTNANVTQYILFSTCGTANITPPAPPPAELPSSRRARPRKPVVSPTNVPVLANLDCLGATSSFVADLVVGSEDANGNLIDTIFATNQTLADGQPLTITGAYVPAVSTTATVTDLGIIDGVSLDVSLVTANGTVFQSDLGLTVGSGSAEGTIVVPSTPGATSVVAIEYSFDFEQALETSLAWGSATPATTTTDYGQIALPSYVTQPQFDLIDQQINWHDAATGVAPSVVFADLSVSRPGANGSTSWEWEIAGPGTGEGTIQFPTLPTDIFNFNVVDTDEPGIGDVASLQLAGGYDAVRANIFSTGAKGLAAPGTSGQLIFQAEDENDDGFVARGHAVHGFGQPHGARTTRHR
jgi:hypothetical protein